MWRRLISRLVPDRAPVSGVDYAPQAEGQPDPGDVVWGWVPYEDDPQQGKDRPVLLLAHDGATDGDAWLGLMLSSQDHDRDAADEASYGRHWMDVGTGGWDRGVFDAVVAQARTFHDFT